MFDKGSTERQLFSEYYKLCEKHWNIDQGAEALCDDVEVFREKYETGDNFAAYLGIALMNRAKHLEQKGGRP